MLKIETIHFYLDQPGWMILVWTLIGWSLCALGIDRVNRRMGFLNVDISRGSLVEIKTALLAAWPVYWLTIFALADRDFSWQVMVTLIPTLMVLPAAIAGMVKREISFPISQVSAGFLVLALLVFCGGGLGIDRTFERIEGHIIFTLLLLYLWWNCQGKELSTVLSSPEPQNRAPKLFSLMVYQFGAFLVLTGAAMIHVRYHFSPGIVFGLLLAGAWCPSLIRGLIFTEGRSGFLITSLPLAILFIVGLMVLLSGSVDFPITIWQMELCTSLVVGMLWVGLTVIRQPLTRMESLLLIVLYLIYLVLRFIRL